MPDPNDSVADPGRLAALRRTGLLDSPPEQLFDRFTHAAAKLMETPLALVTLVDADRQFLKSVAGADAGPDTGGIGPEQETSLSHSLCRHAIACRAPLVIGDARADPRFETHPAVRGADVAAYAGAPIVLEDGHAVGALCVIDARPREWREEQIGSLRSIAAALAEAIARRTAAVDADARGARATVGLDGDATPPRSPEEREPAVAEALASVASFYLSRVDAYARCLAEPDAATPGGLAREARCRAAVVDAKGALLRALEAYDAERGGGGASMAPRAAAALRDGCADFLEAERRRGAASLRFRRAEVGPEDLKRAAVEAAAAEEAMRLTLRDYEMQRA